jgi:hypothetical protein
MPEVASIQTIELVDRDGSLFCMFCGQEISDTSGSLTPCEHTLFVVTDEGIVYRSQRVARWLGSNDEAGSVEDAESLNGTPNEDDDEEVFSPPKMTDAIDIPNAFRVMLYQPPPSGLAAYFGFAPNE